MAEKILIVDDDPETIRLVKLMLSRQGYNVITASSGKQALDLLHAEHPNLILLDVMMPEMDGFQVTRQLRSNPKTANTPILIFSAKTQVDDKVAGYEAGADEYLTKPIHPAELVARIKALLARAKTRTGALNTAEIKNNKVIGVIAPKGGLGASSLTLNLAICLRKYHKKDVIAAELRPGQGTWAIDLGLENPKSLNRLLKMKPGEISSNNIENELMQTPFGVRLLMASNNLEDINLVNATSQMEMVLQFLAGLGSILLLDIGVNILPNIDQVLDLCREVIMVVEPHPGTIERAKILKEELLEKGFGKGKFLDFVLVNRVRADMQLTPADIQETLGRQISEVIPPAPELAYHAAMRSVPLVQMQPEGLVTQQFKRLAASVIQQLEQ